jgi:hypothetical protein
VQKDNSRKTPHTPRDLLAWFKNFKDRGFAEKFDSLWKETSKAARRTGYKQADVNRLIAEVREARQDRGDMCVVMLFFVFPGVPNGSSAKM